jgi:hypothetical protein
MRVQLIVETPTDLDALVVFRTVPPLAKGWIEKEKQAQFLELIVSLASALPLHRTRVNRYLGALLL